jgi:hypothetical protein
MIFCKIKGITFFAKFSSNHNRHFLPFGRADLTASAVLQPIRGGRPQLHGPRLASAAISTRE